jgi:hypothetical protein
VGRGDEGEGVRGRGVSVNLGTILLIPFSFVTFSLYRLFEWIRLSDFFTFRTLGIHSYNT